MNYQKQHQLDSATTFTFKLHFLYKVPALLMIYGMQLYNRLNRFELFICDIPADFKSVYISVQILLS